MTSESKPPVEESCLVSGIDRPVSIRIDRWGLAHIRAERPLDAYFAQGFNAARDRLWQIDLWRKRGLGELAASFGPGFLMQDRAARRFLYRGDMDREWQSYGPQDTRAIVTAFVAGINARVAQVLAEPALLAPEFAATDSLPSHWRPEDVVRIRSHALCRNLPSELARARVFAAGGDARIDRLRRSIAPAHDAVLPDGLDLAGLPDDLLDEFLLATAAVSFSAERMAATEADAHRWSRIDPGGEVVCAADAQGSNAWAVAPSRTATGRAILASDPHRVNGAPSLRYAVHLQAPGLNVIGAGEPMLPGVSIGHNGQLGFGLTSLYLDQEDLYVYELDARDPMRYRYRDDWERFETVRERVATKGGGLREFELLFSRHGAVIRHDPAAARAYAVRTVWSEPGSAAYLASLAYQSVGSLDAFSAALAHWSAPSSNQIVADTAGRIGWFPVGKAPVRPGWDGLLPVPGDGRYEWDGFHPRALLPGETDPVRGYVASANEMNLPDGPARQASLGYEWAEPSRASRIRELLATQAAHSLRDSQRLQHDTVSIPARRIVGLLRGIDSPDVDAARGIALFATWDCDLAPGSAAALLFEIWWMRHLRLALLDLAAPEAAVRAALGQGDPQTLLEWASSLEPLFGADGAARRETCLLDTLAAAVRECSARWGADNSQWRWDALHHGYFAHPLAGLLGAEFGDVGPVPVGGSGATVFNTGYRLGDARAMLGPTFRMVLDVGQWDDSVFVNGPGQSGDPGSPAYRSHLRAWADGSYLPLLYSDAAVDAQTVRIIELRPAPAGPSDSG